MQQHAGLLFLAKDTGRILLILEDDKWTVPTFQRSKSLLEDARILLEKYSQGRILPIELYQSADKGFEYGSYVCLVDEEFLCAHISTIAWANIDHLPRYIHTGLKNTLNNELTRAKLETILVMTNDSKNTKQ
jgi:hypothetical protein